MAQNIAFLGLGTMGAPMTANLARQGYHVKAWNRTPTRPNIIVAQEAGAIIVDSIQEAVANAAIVFTCLGDVPDVKAVLLGEAGVVRSAAKGTMVVDFSTIGSQAAQEIAHELADYQLRFMDAPVSGGDIGAQQGTLTIMVGGAPTDFNECQPYLSAMGKNIRHCGPVGSGQAVKLCNQVLVSIYMIALCEAIKLAEIQGLDPNLMIEVCGTGAAASWALSNLAPKIVQTDFQPGFMIKHILKDLRLVKETLFANNLNLEGLTLANQLFELSAQLDEGRGIEMGTQGMMQAYRQF